MMGLPCASFSMAGLRCSGACCADGALATMNSQAAIAMAPATAVRMTFGGRAEADRLASGAWNECIAKSPYRTTVITAQPSFHVAKSDGRFRRAVAGFHLSPHAIKGLPVEQLPIHDHRVDLGGVRDRVERVGIEQHQVGYLPL